jgi:hypothetical protein
MDRPPGSPSTHGAGRHPVPRREERRVPRDQQARLEGPVGRCRSRPSRRTQAARDCLGSLRRRLGGAAWCRGTCPSGSRRGTGRRRRRRAHTSANNPRFVRSTQQRCHRESCRAPAATRNRTVDGRTSRHVAVTSGCICAPTIRIAEARRRQRRHDVRPGDLHVARNARQHPCFVPHHRVPQQRHTDARPRRDPPRRAGLRRARKTRDHARGAAFRRKQDSG